jgi:hypothetical protein
MSRPAGMRTAPARAGPRFKDAAPCADQVGMATRDKIDARARYAAWSVVLAGCSVADALRRRVALAVVGLAAVLAIFLPAVGAGGLALAEEIASQAMPTGNEPDSATEDKFLEVGGYSISLPDGWRTSPRPPGAAFAASSADGLASTTLIIKRNPSLDLEGFEQRSQRNLEKLGQDVEVIGRVEGDTPADSSVELNATVPVGSALIADDQELISTTRVTLRVAGPYRYYLATTIQPGASEALLEDAEDLGHGLRPWLPS